MKLNVKCVPSVCLLDSTGELLSCGAVSSTVTAHQYPFCPSPGWYLVHALPCGILHKTPEAGHLLECSAAFSGSFVSADFCRAGSPSADLCHSLSPQVCGRSTVGCDEFCTILLSCWPNKAKFSVRWSCVVTCVCSCLLQCFSLLLLHFLKRVHCGNPCPFFLLPSLLMALFSVLLPSPFHTGFLACGLMERAVVCCGWAGAAPVQAWLDGLVAAVWPGPCPDRFVWTSSSPCFSHTTGRHSDTLPFFLLSGLFVLAMKLSAVLQSSSLSNLPETSQGVRKPESLQTLKPPEFN